MRSVCGNSAWRWTALVAASAVAGLLLCYAATMPLMGDDPAPEVKDEPAPEPPMPMQRASTPAEEPAPERPPEMPAASYAYPAVSAQPSGAKYAKLLKKIEVPEDESFYGEFYDWGYWSGTSYRGFSDLPPGYWVYVTPNWYIFGEAAGVPSVSSPVPGTAKRSWGPEQATGPPDTATAGDNTTAWASLSADGQDEWLRLHYDQPVVPAAVHVYETYNPGSVCRITAKTADGQEVELWSGIDPVSQEDAQGVARIGVKADFKTDCITVYLKSKEVPGWNEIDAVGLLDDAEQTHWAVSAEASSSWADGYGTSEVFSPEVYTPESSDQERIARLETEVGQLRRDLNALRDQVQAKTPRP